MPDLQYLMRELPREYARCRRYGHALAILRCDIDRLKLINQGFGREGGDAALHTFHSRASGILRSSDWMARGKDDDFIIVLAETDLAGAAAVAERIRKKMAEGPISSKAGAFTATVSIGYCAVSQPDELATLACEDLLRTAAEQLLTAMKSGYNQTSGARASLAPDAQLPAAARRRPTKVTAPDELKVVDYDSASDEPQDEGAKSWHPYGGS